jgi:hypothetical protein
MILEPGRIGLGKSERKLFGKPTNEVDNPTKLFTAKKVTRKMSLGISWFFHIIEWGLSSCMGNNCQANSTSWVDPQPSQ